ncbi:MAG TPA: PKD domain-containing protein [Methylomirabilota bacterium]|nr:PKD domain-containing protein [Methylomirabilota bacterium]
MASQRHVRRAGGLAWLVLALAVNPARGQGFEIGNYRIVSQTRVDRTVFAYTMRADLTNKVLSAQGVRAVLRIEGSTHTTVVENTLEFGDVARDAHATSLDTFTIRHDRLVPFDPSVFRWTFSVASMPLEIAIDSPASGFLTNGTNVIVTGTVGAAVTAVEVNGQRATLNQGRFAADVPLREGRNTVSAVAGNEFGGTGTAAITVNRDTTPPTLNVETPGDGAILASRQVTVSGMVNDIVPGTVNPEQALVMVNGLSAAVLNRSYSIPDLLLVPGRNVIEVVALDRAGNAARRQIQVTVVEAAVQKRLVKLSGDMQTGMIGTGLAEPLVVELVDGNGVAQTNQPVTFSICRNDGVLYAPPEQGRSLTVRTDDRGQAQVLFQLGTRTGSGNNQVEVTAAGALGQVIFCANATGAPPHRVATLLPETQVGEPGKPLAQPWTAYVIDVGGNPVAGAPIQFMVFQGGGTIDGATLVATNTDADGRASVVHTLGPDEGINNNVVIAVVPGLTNGAATFTASALTPRRPELTRLVGLVLDNANRPLSNILCHVEGTTLETVTDAHGQFVISNVPVGSVRLFVDARNRGYPGTWHPLEFDLVTVAGRDNSVDRPIYMLPLDEAKLAGGDQPVTIQMKGIPGAEMTIFPRSIRGPDGQPIVTNVSFSQVNLERVPMPPPLGSQFMLAWTVQPPGLRFDPPARMCIPNMGAPAGQVVEMFSFDHDLIQFVAIGTATITADGALMCSDPGFGVTKSGWGGCVPPPPPCTPVCSGPPMETDCRKWVTIPPASPCACPTYMPMDKNGPCDDMDMCTVRDMCTNGVCKGEPIMVTKVEPMIDGTNELVRCFMSNQMFGFTAKVEQTNCTMLEYKWDFGDGAMSDMESPMHAYTNGGEYTVKLKVSCKDCPSAMKEGMAKVKLFELKKLIVADNADATNVKTNPGASDLIMLSTNTAKARISAEILPDNADAKKRILWRVDGMTAAPNKGDFTGGSATVDLTISGGNRSFPIKAGCDQNSDGTLQDGEVTHTINFHLATVSFAKSATQKFGFDEDKTNGVHYLSLDKADSTTVSVTVSPFVPGGYWAVSSDTSRMTVAGDGKLTAGTTVVTVMGAGGGGDRESALLRIHACTNTGPILTNLQVKIYKENQVAKVTYYRLLDATVPATTPAKNPSLADLKTEMNKIYKQGVIEILDVDGSTNQNVRFDLNNNGFLDYYNNEADGGPELKAIKDAMLAGNPKIAYVEKLRDNWRLAAAAPAGTNKLVLVNAAGIGRQGYTVGPPSGAGEAVTVTAIAGNVLTLSAPLATAQAATNTIYGGLAGLSSDPQLVTDAGGELIVTIVHEMLHRAVFGNLADVAERDNVMYWTTGGTGDGFLRFRPQTVVDTGTGVPTGATQNQWQSIAR